MDVAVGVVFVAFDDAAGVVEGDGGAVEMVVAVVVEYAGWAGVVVYGVGVDIMDFVKSLFEAVSKLRFAFRRPFFRSAALCKIGKRIALTNFTRLAEPKKLLAGKPKAVSKQLLNYNGLVEGEQPFFAGGGDFAGFVRENA
ncbi:hypothetical protein STSP2_01279 [Anaerohalosphaera lusitana]|uniref:Uncharacterized protein n=1 Tax=Anaerohalosphaera lusitana TaxID=1936003 RepID=A0A1U9NK63_9BACT|nr:hypothetical protein [Anaerohalosphaera lusitana]AQT68124.1 hypothetical protein STSP2_01279 [Anaerohalosphaera lusitana]